MTGYVLISFFIYCLVSALTPGAGNILALNTVTNYGWKKGKPLFFGIFAGYYVVQIICAFFVFGIGSFLPRVLEVMKYIGAIYILWLAFSIAFSKPEISDESGTASFTKGFILQFVNVKIYMFGVTALTGFITPFSTNLSTLVGFEIFIATLGTLSTLLWIGAGILIRDYYLKYYRIINVVLAISLLECVWSILK